ncbi:MAG: glycosyltransferase family 2 protein [Zoogloeaceae bacterium]|jgi:glycosyltransferase involved in cell wall biosynthesis|nr:glycosyltransferase family 2 protein [Zoogloeaceae bacterium]
MKLISIVTPCYNEEENIELLVERIRAVFVCLPQYRYEHIFIDNASSDATVEKIKVLASGDSRIKLIVNSRNFGHIRSPIHAILHAKGDAVVVMASDLQDPPELIPDFLQKWEAGFRIVIGVKPKSQEPLLFFLVRRIFYKTISKISETRLVQNYTGFGLYDRSVIEIVREMDDPYPYFRGMISEIGFKHAEILFEQPRRKRGISKNNFYTLYDMAMLGITTHSKIPLRLATMTGFILAFISLMIAFGYFAAKLLWWDQFSLGMAPLIISLFFFASVQLFFIGILGEYIGSIHTQILKRPLVIETERVNFSDDHNIVPQDSVRTIKHDEANL